MNLDIFAASLVYWLLLLLFLLWLSRKQAGISKKLSALEEDLKKLAKKEESKGSSKD